MQNKCLTTIYSDIGNVINEHMGNRFEFGEMKPNHSIDHMCVCVREFFILLKYADKWIKKPEENCSASANARARSTNTQIMSVRIQIE